MLGRFAGAAAAAAMLLLVAGPCPASNCVGTSTGLVPLTDLGTGLYLGQFQGGLYPGGSNTMPLAHLLAGLAAEGAIVPRDTDGTPDPVNGRVVLMSLGMSNATLEFCIINAGTTGCTPESFMGQAAADPAVNHTTLALVNGAHGGQDAPLWTDPMSVNYTNAATLLASQGLSEAQVQVVWVKQAHAHPTVSLPAANADAHTLEGYLGTTTRTLRVRYPNLQQVFFSSRIYAGYADVTIDPEPYAYETGFSVKWLVEAQITQMATSGTPPDPVAGDLNYGTVAPWIAWGPYLWADGTTARSDGLTYLCSDMAMDGTHPNPGAIQKVATMLLDFLLTSPVTQSWFPAAGAETTTTTTIGSSTTTSIDTSTTTTTLPVVACTPQPRSGCHPAAAGRAELLLADFASNGRDRLRWQWDGSGSPARSAFGNPPSGTGYVLCVYDAGGLRLDSTAPGGGRCAGKPCWRATPTGFRYSDGNAPTGGLQKLSLSAGSVARLTVKERGAGLAALHLPLAMSVRVQLLRTDAPDCWEASYGGTPIRDDAGRFKARSN